jgi:two-component sensor histidine kinase
MFCYTISKRVNLGGEGGTLKSTYNIGYDMLYDNKVKISVKIQKETFQRENEHLDLERRQKLKDLETKMEKENEEFERSSQQRLKKLKEIQKKLWTTEQKQQEWAVYRQNLRDITSQSGYPFNVIWPTKPE